MDSQLLMVYIVQYSRIIWRNVSDTDRTGVHVNAEEFHVHCCYTTYLLKN